MAPTPGKGWYNSRIDDAVTALRKLVTKQPVTDIDTDNLTWLERRLGLTKPLTAYSDRTQRRYISAAKKGQTAHESGKAEYQKRKQSRQQSQQQHALAPSQWNTINKLRNRVLTLGVDVDPYMDDDILKDFATMYGYDYLRRVLTDQIDSTEHYLRGDRQPGNTRWNARGQLEAQFAISIHVYHARGTDPYYYYHGRH